jgi:hypothetical protein
MKHNIYCFHFAHHSLAFQYSITYDRGQFHLMRRDYYGTHAMNDSTYFNQHYPTINECVIRIIRELRSLELIYIVCGENNPNQFTGQKVTNFCDYWDHYNILNLPANYNTLLGTISGMLARNQTPALFAGPFKINPFVPEPEKYEAWIRENFNLDQFQMINFDPFVKDELIAFEMLYERPL